MKRKPAKKAQVALFKGAVSVKGYSRKAGVKPHTRRRPKKKAGK